MKIIIGIVIGFIIAGFYFGNTSWNREKICKKISSANYLECLIEIKS